MILCFYMNTCARIIFYIYIYIKYTKYEYKSLALPIFPPEQCK